MSPPTIWRWAAAALPAGFAERHRDEMLEELAGHLAGRGALARGWIWTRAAADALWSAVLLRRADRARRGREEGRGIMDVLLQDTGFAVRALRRRPGFAAVAVLTLALGIGANTTIFSVVHGVLLQPLPYPDGERIGILWHEFGDGAQNLPAVHPLDVVDYRDRSQLFETFTMATGREWILGGAEAPEMVDVGVVEAGFVEFFGGRVLHGRTVSPEEDVPGADPVVMLSHRLWERRFGADPDVVGREIEVAGTTAEVVGVLAPSFRLLLPAEAFLLRDAELWVSLRLDPGRQPPRNFTGLTAFGRLREGATFAQAQQELEGMAARLAEEHPEHAASRLRARVEPLHLDVVKGARRTLLLLFGAVGFVLLIACANVANLLIVRGHARAGELSLRAALGAGRGALVRLVLAESLLLSGAGAALGLALTVGGLELLRAVGRGSVPRLDSVAIDGTVLGFAASVGVASALLFGFLPALRATRRDPADALHADGRGGTGRERGRTRDLLIVAEVAASLILLVGTGLMVRSFTALGRVDPGYGTEGALTFRVNLPFPAFSEDEERLALRQELFEEIGALPGVRAVAAVSQLPLTGSGPLQPYAYDEETASNWESVTADQRWVSRGFFRAMGARLLRGRELTLQDAEAGDRIVVDDRLAARAFPDGDRSGGASR